MQSGGIMIYPCTCTHEYQDKLYGKGRRVYNIGKTHKHCTVCGNKIPLTADETKSAKSSKEDAPEKKSGK